MSSDDHDSARSRRGGIQSIEIGMRILEVLAAHRSATPLSAVAQATAMPAPQVHRYLKSLIVAGMARQDQATGRYDLGPAALRIGLAALSRTDAFTVVDRAVSEFVERTGQTVQIAALGSMGPTVVRIYNGRPALHTTLHVGSVIPLVTSATGRIFLAFAPPSETIGLVAEELQTTPAKAAAVLDGIRTSMGERRADVESGTVIVGLQATAFPILDLQGRAILVATALSSQGSTPSPQPGAIEELGLLCRSMSVELGWPDPA
jgi:DNA-binding IclR family transcriptional regulator